jgi:outer membrane biosynthesis protein TonB
LERSCEGPRDPATPKDSLDLGLYLDGMLPDGAQKLVEQHLRQCIECSLRLGELREIKASLEDRTAWGVHASTGERACLSAADVLLTMSGKGSPRAQEHLLACDACRLDVVAIEDSTVEYLAGKTERLAPELMTALRALGATSGEGLAPIISLPEAQKAVRNGSKRLSPKPSKRLAASSRAQPAVAGRRVRGRPAAAGAFALVAAAAAAVIVVLVASQSGPSEPQDTSVAVAPRAPSPPVKPAVHPTVHPGVKPTAPATKPASPEEKDAPEPETIPAPPPPQGPDLEPAPAPAPSETPAPAPGPDAGPTVARGPDPKPGTTPAAAPRGTAREPSPLDAPVSDDGGRVDVDLSRVSGTLAYRAAGDSASPTADRWTPVARSAGVKDGHLSLKPGDRIRSSSGAFVSLSDAAAGEAPYDLCLAARTELVVRSAANGPVLGLADGRVLCEVEKLTDKHLVIATTSGEFECTGTVFSVSADDRKAVCAVEEGTVLCHGQAGEPKPVSAGYMLSLARGAAAGDAKPCGPDPNAWARGLRPERQVVYAATFDRPNGADTGGFAGETTAEGAFRGVGRSLIFEPATDNKFWGMSALAPRNKLKPFRAAPDMRLTFSFWLEKQSHVLVQTLCERLGRNYKRDLKTNPANRWITVTIPLMDMETYFDPGKNPMREGDVFTEIEIYAGEPGEHFKALLDDVMIYKKLYR